MPDPLGGARGGPCERDRLASNDGLLVVALNVDDEGYNVAKVSAFGREYADVLGEVIRHLDELRDVMTSVEAAPRRET